MKPVKKTNSKNKIQKLLPVPKPTKCYKIIEERQGMPIICFATNPDCYQELTLFPELVWDKILPYMTDTKDVLALLNTSPFLHQKMKEIGLFQHVIRKVMKVGRLDFHNTLNCRLVNKDTKSVIDETFKEINSSDTNSSNRQQVFSDPLRNEYTQEPHFLFYDNRGIDQFIGHFERFPVLSGNPFVNDRLQLWAEDWNVFDRAMLLLARFGHLVTDLELGLAFVNIPATLLRRLIIALHHVPNLHRLRFYFTGFPPGIDVLNENQERVDLAIAFPVPTAAHFPPLPKLVELEFTQQETELVRLDEEPREPFEDVTRALLAAYGRQLSLFKCGNKMFGLGLPVELFNNHLFNLPQLTVCNIDLRRQRAVAELAALANIQLPRLRSLSLNIVARHWENNCLQTLVLVLNNFRNSLEELHLWSTYFNEKFAVGPLPPVMLPLPKLKLLTLQPPNLISDWWTVFQAQFRHLETLEFRKIGPHHSHFVGPQLPTFKERRAILIGFKTKQSHVEGHKLVAGTIKQTVITRKEASLRKMNKSCVSTHLVPYRRW
ncbi:hypothetical protein Ocin01_06149 [Orchesella cincta]|uniref:Uncharacterized protein n=1 Tax=Orchesella cincta TaxID=48709 RepID=A0A1D2N5K7_ORCCI|nr:hypothetical protein Ocin01_06149 [Orchesella cincta]